MPLLLSNIISVSVRKENMEASLFPSAFGYTCVLALLSCSSSESLFMESPSLSCTNQTQEVSSPHNVFCHFRALILPVFKLHSIQGTVQWCKVERDTQGVKKLGHHPSYPKCPLGVIDQSMVHPFFLRLGTLDKMLKTNLSRHTKCTVQETLMHSKKLWSAV